MTMIPFRCIGRKQVGRDLIRCENTSNEPSYPDKPQWGWLCPSCAGAPTIGSARNTKGIVEEREK